MNERYTIGIDLGGTKLLAALVDEQGNIVSHKQQLTDVSGGKEAVISQIARSVKDFMSEPWVKDKVKNLGISAAGPVDPLHGRLVQGTNFGWNDAPLKSIFEDMFQIPVCVENDANAAAIAEHRIGAGKGSTDMVYVTISTGIGGGLILGGQLYRGATFAAGEIGHIVVETEGPLCNCGGMGCVESLASGPATARRAVARIMRDERSSISELVGGQLERVSAETVYQAAANGDQLAREVVYQSGKYIGIALASVVNILNPQVIVVGGGVSKAGDLLFKPLLENLTCRVMKAQRNSVQVIPAKFGNFSAVLGAALLSTLDVNV
ncbi:MAG: ROK family protein [Desulfitobacterium hafniense]|nr:ROK family protein [Desulfitobacterium hafniense]